MTYSEYSLNRNKVNGYNAVTLFARGYGSVMFTCQLPDGTTETIILQDVVHLPGSFNVIAQTQIMDKDVKVEPVNHNGLNLYNWHAKMICHCPSGRWAIRTGTSSGSNRIHR
jgi:hypothetical protein